MVVFREGGNWTFYIFFTLFMASIIFVPLAVMTFFYHVIIGEYVFHPLHILIGLYCTWFMIYAQINNTFIFRFWSW